MFSFALGAAATRSGAASPTGGGDPASECLRLRVELDALKHESQTAKVALESQVTGPQMLAFLNRFGSQESRATKHGRVVKCVRVCDPRFSAITRRNTPTHAKRHVGCVPATLLLSSTVPVALSSNFTRSMVEDLGLNMCVVLQFCHPGNPLDLVLPKLVFFHLVAWSSKMRGVWSRKNRAIT